MKFDADLKDLIVRLLHPHPQKRLGYHKTQELTQHPFFQGCFDERHAIREGRLAKATFKVEPSKGLQSLNPIPYEMLFRIDDDSKGKPPVSDIPGFTHVDTSALNEPFPI